MSQQFLNYSLTTDIKLYYKAIASLSQKFDLMPANMRGFIQALSDKARNLNWQMTLVFMVRGAMYDLIRQYGSVTLNDVRQHALTYMGSQTRNAQNSNQIYTCLSETLTPEAKNKVALETSKFVVNDESDGLLYFKVIVGLAQVDTRATVTVIRTSLSSLDTKIVELQDNIIELNQFVKTQMDGLEARGETTDDLLVNLFKAYHACGDADFITWIKSKENDYNEGRTNFTPQDLMSLADNKYKGQLEAGKWMQTSTAQKRIVAMAAQIESLVKAGAAAAAVKRPDASPKRDRKNKGWDWLDICPTAGQPTEKDVDGKHFRWCVYHTQKGTGGKWVQHTLADCKIRIEQEAAKAKGKPVDTGSGKMKVAGMVTVLQEDDDF